MAEQQALIIQPSEQLVARPTTPMEMLAVAVNQNCDVAKLEKLMELQLTWQANEARMAFEQAMCAFKAESIRIIRDKTNTQYQSKYVSLSNLIETVTPYLSKHGLSASWAIDQTAGIKVTCVLTHRLGHSKSTSMTAPADDSGKKNPIQQIKSAITYAKVCTFESVCGLASSDGNLDDDGNGTSMGELAERLEWIENARNLPELKKLYLEAYELAEKANDKSAMAAIIAAKDAKKRSLQ